MSNHSVLKEAYAYAKPSSFSRGMRIELNGHTILLISCTASIDENGVSTLRLAVLIDAENAQLAILAALLAEVAKLGSTTVKRLYGDFTPRRLRPGASLCWPTLSCRFSSSGTQSTRTPATAR
jgi:hypothetical protein